ncbi:MAG: outer membrane lipoprotein carrier protein LolA [Bacteroidetes bacterium]|jgi:outer membrane lipoprotein-sorting protein|nr:outer membrane lipoprotein carrier protein LolA [Bacteroidota bacterium]MDA1115080.1 outer membrane lipoprotein carrier protein LolA [Bacteroidota bacterium]
MRNLNQSFWIAFLLMTGTLVVAQSSPEAKAQLDKVTKVVSGYSNIEIEFTYELVNSEADVNSKTKGTILLAGDKYKLSVLGITRLYDGSKLYTISPEDEEVTISSGKEEGDETISPNEMLKFFNTGYHAKMDIVQKLPGRSIQFIKLVPVKKNEEISYLLLGIDKATNMVYRLIEIGSQNTKTVLTVDSYKVNSKLPANALKYDSKDYSGYFINKLD